MIQNKYTVLDCISIRPNKICMYKKFFNNFAYSEEPVSTASPTITLPVDKTNTENKKQVQINKHNFEISPTASARIKEKISWLYELSKNKTLINEVTGKQFSFKINFITLTLPSFQKHTSSEITKNCLNQFLTECKKAHNLQNYVWRLEFQKNGNVHYHIATDCYMHYKPLQEIWNRCLAKLGYIDDYAHKFNEISLLEYCKKYSNDGQTSLKTLKKRYQKGKLFEWKNPNTVDVRTVQNHKAIQFYIAKYITKKSEHSLNKVVSTREDTVSNLRLWYCSRSLSKTTSIQYFIDSIDPLIDKFYSTIKHSTLKVFDYCKVLYYSLHKEDNEHKRLAWQLYARYGREVGYVPFTL